MRSLSHSTMKNIQPNNGSDFHERNLSPASACSRTQVHDCVHASSRGAHRDRAPTMPPPMLDYLCLAALTKSDSRVRRKLIFLLATNRHRLLRTQMAFLMPTTSVCTNPFRFNFQTPIRTRTHIHSEAFALSVSVCVCVRYY